VRNSASPSRHVPVRPLFRWRPKTALDVYGHLYGEWSTNPPTEPGRYWWRLFPNHFPSVVQLYEPTDNPKVAVTIDENVHVMFEASSLPGEWWPERIEPPHE